MTPDPAGAGSPGESSAGIGRGELSAGARRGETRWPAAAAVLAAVVVQVLLTDRLVPGPTLLLPGLEMILLAGLLVADPSRLSRESKDLRLLAVVVIGLVALINAVALGTLVNRLVGSGLSNGRELLGSAAGVWLTNVLVFGLAYWELDRGGPLARAGARAAPASPDLWFPQDADPRSAAPGWQPVFADYLFVSLTSATAFSPTDAMPLTPRAKLLMGVQSLVSLLTIGLVAARAVNILK